MARPVDRTAARTWATPRKLNSQPMQIEWLADTTLGAMLGDYISVSYVRGTRRAGARARQPAHGGAGTASRSSRAG